ncbi:rhomboid family intramembrane serine protease [Candidatus Methanoperedens nitratireducens]|uniref:rhomboid family intramembrane serine protease n=1 Tax=Candidatus Methanoperedens nitratireducens TaxID=1392998 RepID=UPI000BB8123C
MVFFFELSISVHFFYLLSGLAAAFAQIAVYPASRIPSVGASGAIAGILGAYRGIYGRSCTWAHLQEDVEAKSSCGLKTRFKSHAVILAIIPGP